MSGAGVTRACLFLFLFLKVRAGGAASPGGAGSGVQDAGVLGDRLVQVGGSDGERDVQPFQVVPFRALPGVQGVERDAPGLRAVCWYRHPAPPVAHMRSANRSGQAATISPQASCQPWVMCPSISRGAPAIALRSL